MPKGIYKRVKRAGVSSAQSAYWSRLSQFETRTAYDAAYYLTHREQKLGARRVWRLTHPAEIRESNKKWALAHPDVARNSLQRYQARKKGAFVEDVDRQVVFLNDVGICQWQYCSEPSPFVDPQDWHLDHIIPLSKGGEHRYSNTQVTHPLCNMQKGDRIDTEN